jgi:hypothetical protein
MPFVCAKVDIEMQFRAHLAMSLAHGVRAAQFRGGSSKRRCQSGIRASGSQSKLGRISAPRLPQALQTKAGSVAIDRKQSACRKRLGAAKGLNLGPLAATYLQRQSVGGCHAPLARQDG